jgi:uncharacterized damage-inducible protein DinB
LFFADWNGFFDFSLTDTLCYVLPTCMNLLRLTNQHILSQLADLLEEMSDEAYTTALPLLHGSSVGQHVRHTVEFYDCLLQQSVQGYVNYDARQRDYRLENSLPFVRLSVEELVAKMAFINTDLPLQHHTTFGGELPQPVPTSLARELVYLAEHAIHHFAIIKIALREAFPEIPVSDQFGVAFSTLKYRQGASMGS